MITKYVDKTIALYTQNIWLFQVIILHWTEVFETFDILLFKHVFALIQLIFFNPKIIKANNVLSDLTEVKF